jgi:hypothetical protein
MIRPISDGLRAASKCTAHPAQAHQFRSLHQNPHSAMDERHISTTTNIPRPRSITKFAGTILGKPAFEFNAPAVRFGFESRARRIIIGAKGMEKFIMDIDDIFISRILINDQNFPGGINGGIIVIDIDGWHIFYQ